MPHIQTIATCSEALANILLIDFFEKVSEYPTVTQVSDLVKEVSHLPGCEHVDTEHLKRYFRRKRKNKRKRERKSGMEVNVVDAASQSDFCEEPEGVLESEWPLYSTKRIYIGSSRIHLKPRQQ